MTHHFSCSGREKIEKNIFRSFWPNWAPNLGQKGSFWVKIFKKMKIFQKFFFSIWMILSRKKAKKRWKFFFLTKLVWHLVIFGQKMRILDLNDSERKKAKKTMKLFFLTKLVWHFLKISRFLIITRLRG